MSAMGLIRALILPFAATALLTSCAAPSLALYTLGAPAVTSDTGPLGGRATVIEIARVTLPDYLDTQDILVRNGNTLERSHQGRWASRLSLGITDLLTARLAQRRPDALVTDQPQTQAPSYRILINISRLDVTVGGVATLEADWLIVPRDPAMPTRRNRAQFSATGPVATDQDVVALEEGVLDRLANAIDVTRLR
jgi:uncharacterized lipoprotein YmbA